MNPAAISALVDSIAYDYPHHRAFFVSSSGAPHDSRHICIEFWVACRVPKMAYGPRFCLKLEPFAHHIGYPIRLLQEEVVAAKHAYEISDLIDHRLHRGFSECRRLMKDYMHRLKRGWKMLPKEIQ